jgi:N-carbamoylputrescine amidase
MQDVTVAAINFRAEFGNFPANLARIQYWTESLQAQGAEIICFPEMCLTGYDRTPAIAPLAVTAPGPELDTLARLAARLNITLLVGFAEVDPQARLYISQAVITPTGLAGLYRKTHLNRPEQQIFSAGNEAGVFQLPGCMAGLQLCYDAHFPELSTVQALAGAEVIFVASASPRDDPDAKRERMLRYLPARAYDNGCYVVACNLIGPGARGQTFGGVALVLNPKGEILAQAVGWDEGAAIARLEAAQIDRLRRTQMGYFLAHRRPELYSYLTRCQPGDICRS